MKPVMILIGVAILMLLSPAVLISIDAFRLAEYEEAHIVTTSGATSSDVTLTNDLYGGNTYNAVVTSNVTGDAPVPSAYSVTTKALTVSGLLDNTSHRLTVTYQIDGLEDYWGAQTGARTWPLFLILGVIGCIAAAVYTSTRKSD